MTTWCRRRGAGGGGELLGHDCGEGVMVIMTASTGVHSSLLFKCMLVDSQVIVGNVGSSKLIL